MPRPFCCRRVCGEPPASFFKPAGVPVHQLEVVQLTLDEFEAIRLADLSELYQDKAAKQMGVSRPTFSRIIERAHRKLADALVHGKALRIEGGAIEQAGRRCCRLHDGMEQQPAKEEPGRASIRKKGRLQS